MPRNGGAALLSAAPPAHSQPMISEIVRSVDRRAKKLEIEARPDRSASVEYSRTRSGRDRLLDSNAAILPKTRGFHLLRPIRDRRDGHLSSGDFFKSLRAFRICKRQRKAARIQLRDSARYKRELFPLAGRVAPSGLRRIVVDRSANIGRCDTRSCVIRTIRPVARLSIGTF